MGLSGSFIRVDNYYPFGLTFNSYSRENSVKQRFKFQGQEHIDDLDLGWDSFKWRNHQPDIGRFFNIDPLAEDYYYNSPYAFSENKVVAHTELEGLESRPVNSGGTNNRAPRYGGNPTAIRNAASRAAEISRRPAGFATTGAREGAMFTRTTRYSFDRTGNSSNASNSYGRSSNAGDETNPDNTHGFGNRAGNAMKVAVDIADNAKTIIIDTGSIQVVESFTENQNGGAISLGKDIIVGDGETQFKLVTLDQAFHQVVQTIAMDGMSQGEWENLDSGGRLLRVNAAYLAAGPSPSQIAAAKAQEGQQEGETSEHRYPTIRRGN